MPETSTTLFFAGLAAAAVLARYLLSNPLARQPDAATPPGSVPPGPVPPGSAPPGSVPPGSAPPRSAPREVTEDLVDIVQVMVPTTDRNVIRASLEETRSVEITTQRLLNLSASTAPKNETFSSVSDEEVLARAEEPKPANWLDDRQEREKHMKLQREKMIAKARLRTKQLQAQN